MAKLTNKSANGTSFHDTYLTSTVSIIKEKFGEPQSESNYGQDKINFDWTGETKNGDIFTIYDWKEYRVLDENETIEFHIGGRDHIVTSKAKTELRVLGI